MKEAPFAILHDGVVQKISGTIPGQVNVEVRCDYLRKRYSVRGETFILQLVDCTQMRFTNEQGVVTENFEAIMKAKPEMLSADTIQQIVVVYCSNGTLEMRFRDSKIFLNETESTSVDGLEDSARAYWDEWDESANSRQPHP